MNFNPTVTSSPKVCTVSSRSTSTTKRPGMSGMAEKRQHTSHNQHTFMSSCIEFEPKAKESPCSPVKRVHIDQEIDSFATDYWGDSTGETHEIDSFATDYWGDSSNNTEETDSEIDSFATDYWGDASNEIDEKDEPNVLIVTDQRKHSSANMDDNSEADLRQLKHWNQECVLEGGEWSHSGDVNEDYENVLSDVCPILYFTDDNCESSDNDGEDDAELPTEDSTEQEGSNSDRELVRENSTQDVAVPAVPKETEKTPFTPEQAYKVIQLPCCEKWCLRDFSVNEVIAYRTNSINKDWVLQKLKIFRSGDDQSKSNFVVAGKSTCASGWKVVHGISDKMFNEACDLHNRKIVEVIHGNRYVQRNNPKALTTQTWLGNFIKIFGEYMPHMKLTLLPSALTKKMIFNKMVEDYRPQHLQSNVVKWRQFYNIWRTHFPNVKIRKESNFTKCTVCTVTAEERGKTLNKDKRKAIDGILNKHLELAANERATYERHKEKARKDDKYLCIAIDGMDQSKTSLPHLTRLDKGSQHLWRLHTHLTGALIHGTMDYGKDVIIFANTSDLPSDSNLTLNVLMYALETYIKKHHKLPEVLYLQFDNCWRENKNMFILGFAYLLVAMGIVQKIKINFLLVGHTHNDVDQAFSRIAEALRKWAALTLDKLNDVIKKSYEKPSPDVVVLNHLYDFKAWLGPHFAGQFKNHSRPHNFRIKKINGQTVLHYRLHTGDKWEPSEGLTCLKSIPELTNVPAWIKPILDRVCINMLHKDIPKFFHRLGSEEQIWWNNYLQNFLKLKEPPASSTHWPMMAIAAAVDTSVSEDLDVGVALPANLGPIWEKLNKPMQPVTIGSQGKNAQPRSRSIQGTVGNDITEIEQGNNGEDSDQGDISEVEENSSVKDLENSGDMKQYSSIAKGMLVAVYVEHHWSSSPQIGMVLDISLEEESFLIHWYAASWSGKCSPLYDGCGSHRKPKTELLDIRCCLLWQFRLTYKKEALPSATVQKLKCAYRDLDLEC